MPLKMSRSCWAFLMLVAAPVSALVAHPLAGRASSPTFRLRGGNGEIDRTMVGKVPDGVETLKQRFGGAPDAELGRFLAKQRGDVEKAASVYAEALKWRDARKGQAVAGVENVPEWMWKFETGRARDNTTVLWVQGAMYDSRAADGAAYVEKTVRLLERMLPTDSHDMLTVLVDVRAYPGMPSESASKVVSYFAKMAPVLAPLDMRRKVNSHTS